MQNLQLFYIPVQGQDICYKCTNTHCMFQIILLPNSKCIYQDSKLLAHVACFAESVETTLLAIWAEKHYTRPESTKQMEEKLNFQVPAEGLELVILLHTQY